MVAPGSLRSTVRPSRISSDGSGALGGGPARSTVASARVGPDSRSDGAVTGSTREGRAEAGAGVTSPLIPAPVATLLRTAMISLGIARGLPWPVGRGLPNGCASVATNLQQSTQ